MKKLSLNIKKIALRLLVVGLAVGFQSMKAEEKTLNFWFAVDPSDSQTILDPTDPIEEPSGNCSLTLADVRCAVQLNTSTAPATVSAAQTAGSYVNSAYQDEN
jgi:hypothetical protein